MFAGFPQKLQSSVSCFLWEKESEGARGELNKLSVVLWKSLYIKDELNLHVQFKLGGGLGSPKPLEFPSCCFSSPTFVSQQHPISNDNHPQQNVTNPHYGWYQRASFRHLGAWANWNLGCKKAGALHKSHARVCILIAFDSFQGDFINLVSLWLYVFVSTFNSFVLMYCLMTV